MKIETTQRIGLTAKIWLQPGYGGNSKNYGKVRDSILIALRRNKYAEDAVDFVFGRHYWEPKNYSIWAKVRGPLLDYFKEEGLQ